MAFGCVCGERRGGMGRGACHESSVCVYDERRGGMGRGTCYLSGVSGDVGGRRGLENQIRPGSDGDRVHVLSGAVAANCRTR